VTADDAVSDALVALASALEELGAPAMLIGGIAVIARGVPRTTLAVDATVWAGALDLGRTVTVFGRHGIVPRIEAARQFAEQHQVLLLRHGASGTLEVEARGRGVVAAGPVHRGARRPTCRRRG
jgi:hypothetical protein